VDMDGVVIDVSRQASVHDAFSGCESVGMFPLWTPLPNSSIFDWSFSVIHATNLQRQGPKEKRLKPNRQATSVSPRRSPPGASVINCW